MEAFLKHAGKSKNDKISYQEFLTAVIPIEELTNDTYLKQAFQIFTEDDTNEITAESLAEVLKFIDGIDLKLARTIIAKFDKDKDGMLEYDEFKALIMEDNTNR